MAIEITIPRLGWSMEEGVFSQWLKRDGDTVREGDALFELESDKAVQQVESFDGGILSIPTDGPRPGDVVRIGQRIGYLCRKGEQASASGTPVDRSAVSPSVRRLARQIGVDVNSIQPSQEAGRTTTEEVLAAGRRSNERQSHPKSAVAPVAESRIRVSPRAARSAMRLGVNLLDVTAMGSSGRICERDVLAAAARAGDATPTFQSDPSALGVSKSRDQESSPIGKTEVPSSLRRTIAARMLTATRETASVTLQALADATELVNLRRQYKAATACIDVRVPGYTDLLVKLCAVALEKHPTMLGQWTEDGIVTPHGIHIAVAVDTPAGLLTPVLKNAAELTLPQISLQLQDLIHRARSRQASAQELQDGVFTISNLGGYHVDRITPILNLPQTAILGVGRISAQPTVVGGSVDVRDCVTFSLTFDHRVVDGAAAAAFLTTVCELCERPLLILLS